MTILDVLYSPIVRLERKQGENEFEADVDNMHMKCMWQICARLNMQKIIVINEDGNSKLLQKTSLKLLKYAKWLIYSFKY